MGLYYGNVWVGVANPSERPKIVYKFAGCQAVSLLVPYDVFGEIYVDAIRHVQPNRHLGQKVYSSA